MNEKYVVTTKGIEKQKEIAGNYIREISTKEDLEELIERMPYIQTIQAPNGKVRKELYQIAMEGYDDVELVRIIKSVYLRMEEGRYEAFEPEYLKKAKDFLHKEMSIQFAMPYENIEDYINETIARQLKEF